MAYRVRVLQLSGQLLGEVELMETASVVDILAAIQRDPWGARNSRSLGG